MNAFEQAVVDLLKKGYSQKGIAEELEKNKLFNAQSVSYVEKTINVLKKRYGVKTLFQLGMVVEKNKI